MYYNKLYRFPYNTEFRYSHASPGIILWDKKTNNNKKKRRPPGRRRSGVSSNWRGGRGSVAADIHG